MPTPKAERTGRTASPGRTTKARSVSGGRKTASPSRAGGKSPRTPTRKASPARAPARKAAESSSTSQETPEEQRLKPVKMLLSGSSTAARKTTSRPTSELTPNSVLDIMERTRLNKENNSLRKRGLGVDLANGDTLESMTRVSVTVTKIDEIDGKQTVVQQSETYEHRSVGGKDQSIRKTVIGPFLSILLVPAIAVFTVLICNKKSCQLSWPTGPWRLSSYFDWQAVAVVVGYLLIQAVLTALPVGRTIPALTLQLARKQYRCNGFISLFVSLVAYAALVYLNYPVSVFVSKKFLPLLVASIIVSFIISVLLLIRARRQPLTARPVASTGALLEDFVNGGEVSPRLGPIDIKLLIKMHAGPIAWVLVNASLLLAAYERNVTPPASVLLVACCQLLYVIDLLWFEASSLSMPGYTMRGLGFQVVCGSLTWTPFVFSLQCRYLSDHPSAANAVPIQLLVLAVLLHIIGHAIYRDSISLKDKFKRDSRNTVGIKTVGEPGRQLLAGGWWGVCRHPNYLGDILMALSWSVACGVESVVPYFYPLYLSLLLIGRIRQEEKACRAKYGVIWDQYTEVVKSRLVPYLY